MAGWSAAGFGTVANALVIGTSINVLQSIGAFAELSTTPLGVRIGLLIVGILLFGIGSRSISAPGWARDRATR